MFWARGYVACVECGSTERKHEGHGLCYNCYHRRDMRERMNDNGRRPGKYFIYALLDPRDGKPHYVGCTTNPEARYQDHAYCNGRKQAPLTRWLKKLKQYGTGPQMTILETVTVSVDSRNKDPYQREFEWIRKLRDHGVPLLNIFPT